MKVLSLFTLSIFLITYPSLSLHAQLSDDFSDGDFTQNPAWLGETTLFQVNGAFQLQSNGNSSSDTIYLITPNSLVSQTEWRFDLDYNFGPSTTNNLRVYLIADQSDLEGPINGYYLKVGESGSNDSYDLYRQDGNSSTKIIDGIDGKAASSVDATIKITRDAIGNWELFIDQGKTGAFSLEGSVNDNTYNTSAFFGVWIKHTSTRSNAFFFDNFYIGAEQQDTIPPEVEQISIIDNETLEVIFDENVEINSSQTLSNYVLLPGNQNPISAIRNSQNNRNVELILGLPLSSPNSYQLIISQVEDLEGNSIISDTFDFDYIIPETAEFKDVIINEIFPDPTPTQGLPDGEFLELFNRSDKLLDLSGWTVDNGTVTTTLPAFELSPGEFLILTASSDKSQYESFGNTISPSGWPTLVNGGDNLGLRSNEGILIDTVDYQTSWYKDEIKQAGGFSLELINPGNLDCPPKANWTATLNMNGGTPGMINSAFNPTPEQDPPILISSFLINDNTLEICFNESMDQATVSNPANYIIDQGIGNPSSIQVIEPDFECVQLTLSQSIGTGIIYQLSIDNLADCSGNIISQTIQTQIVIGEEAQPFEVIITEILADVSPQKGLPEAEFIEVFNRTNKVLDIAQYLLTDGSKSAILPNINIFPEEYLILCSVEDTAAFASFGKTIGLADFPSLGNTNDSIYFFSPFGETIDYVFYSDDWYQDNEKAEGGWTLEKIDPDFVDCNNSLNWAASNDNTGGTPGKANSMDGEFLDTNPANLLNISIISNNQLKLTFDEPLDLAELENAANYEIDQGIGNPMIVMADAPHFTSVELIFDTEIDSNRIYILSVSGLKDCSGNEFIEEIALGIPVKAEAGDILLNEILFDPYSGGSDFVEIANVSTKVLDLNEIRIGEIFPETDSIFNDDLVSQESRLFLPGEFICLTANVSFQQLTYLPPPSANFLEMRSFPTYDDSRGEAIIFTNDGVVLDRFEYLDDYHYPTLDDDEGVSLERISLQRPTSDISNWHSAGSLVRYATPGYENSQGLELSEPESAVSLEYQTFTPNDDGERDVLPINYNFDFPGAHARISIFDTNGRKIKELIPGELLTPQPGTFFWDGTNSKNQKADLGLYIILFEVVNQNNGKKEVYRMVGVLGDRF